VTSSVVVFETAIRVKSMYMIKWLKNTAKKREYGNHRSFYI